MTSFLEHLELLTSSAGLRDETTTSAIEQWSRSAANKIQVGVLLELTVLNADSGKSALQNGWLLQKSMIL